MNTYFPICHKTGIHVYVAPSDGEQSVWHHRYLMGDNALSSIKYQKVVPPKPHFARQKQGEQIWRPKLCFIL